MRVFIVLLLAIPSFLSAQTHLNGLSVYEQLGKEYYVGALYLADAQTEPQTIVADKRSQKMVLKVSAKRWSPRKFEQVWRQDLALNNDLSSDLELTELLLAFTRFPKENLTTGDELLFRYTSTAGSEVFLNDERVLQASGKKLYNALMRAWLGDVPHSRHFQSQILGMKGSVETNQIELQERFEASSIPKNRTGLVSAWREDEEATLLALAKAKEELKLQKQREEEAKKRAAAEQRKRDQERKEALALAEQKKKEAEAAKAQELDEAKVAEALAAQRAAEERAAELAKAQKAQQAEKIEVQQTNVALAYARELYLWEVTRDVYKRVSYPEWARQFNQEGIVTIEFIVGNQGQLLGVSSVSPADSGLLGQELKDAVSRAAPFNTFPVQLTDRQIQIVIDYEFTLEERVAEAPPRPLAPEGLDENVELTSVQKAVQWAKYKDQVVAQIEASIEYPFWAQDLKQEGIVSAEVVVQSDGTVKKVKLKKRSRHNILNQEVEQAIDRIGSFSAFPEWVSDSTLTVLIEHNFKL